MSYIWWHLWSRVTEESAGGCRCRPGRLLGRGLSLPVPGRTVPKRPRTMRSKPGIESVVLPSDTGQATLNEANLSALLSGKTLCANRCPNRWYALVDRMEQAGQFNRCPFFRRVLQNVLKRRRVFLHLYLYTEHSV